jgi:hypothetical protein
VVDDVLGESGMSVLRRRSSSVVSSSTTVSNSGNSARLLSGRKLTSERA